MVRRRAVLVFMLGSLLFFDGNRLLAQERITDQVSITVVDDRLLGIGTGEGIVRMPLTAGERVIGMDVKGLNGFVYTSSRLLGFSGLVQRWVERRLRPSETIETWEVTPRLIFVQGTERVYGFQGPIGRWKVQECGVNETLLRVIVEDHVVVVITERRALGFSTFTGGFFTKDLPLAQNLLDVQANDNIVLLTFDDRRLLFRSGLAIWAELR